MTHDGDDPTQRCVKILGGPVEFLHGVDARDDVAGADALAEFDEGFHEARHG